MYVWGADKRTARSDEQKVSLTPETMEERLHRRASWPMVATAYYSAESSQGDVVYLTRQPACLNGYILMATNILDSSDRH